MSASSNINNKQPDALITDHIDIWASAIKRKSTQGRGSSKKVELYGVKKLRELILELAVRGLLVPQDPSDEAALVLLEKIAAEKEQLIKEKKIKKQKNLPSIDDDEKPFELPKGWEWVRFGDVYDLEYGDNLPKTKRSETGEYPVYGSNGVVGTHKEFCVDKPCIVVGRKGSAGALNLSLSNGCWVTDVAYSVIPPSCLDLNFIFKQFHTLGLDNLGKGIKPGLNRNEAYIVTVAIPPIEEQQRIVTKVNELMTLCDQLEQQQETSITVHQTLVETLLNALLETASHTQGEEGSHKFQQAWERIAENFDLLFTTERSINQLKQTILQLAVMGKLVPQASAEERKSPDYEPASELLKKIAAEKERLTQEEKLKTKANEAIADSELYISTPTYWRWVRLGNLAKFIDYRGKTPTKIESGIRLITAKNVRFGYIDLEPQEFISEDEYTTWMTRGFPKIGDLLFTPEAPLGNIATIDIEGRFALAQRAICFQPHIPLISNFLKLFIMASPFQKQLLKNASGMTATGIKASKLKEIPIALPSQEEQHRIVTKVNELMALCNNMLEHIKAAQTTQLKLTDAIAEQAIN